jgi:hypothetical protein
MSHFKQLPEFEKELKRLSKKYPTLHQDIKDLESVLCVLPTGSGKNFTIIHHSEKVKLVKTRLACKSLKNRAMRVIYAYHCEIVTFVYIELYFKGNKANEDRERISEYLKSV